VNRYLYFFVLTIACFTLRSQSVFAPIGSTWNYDWQEHTGAYHGPETLYYTGDTLIGGITHKKIAKAYSYSCVCPNPIYGSDCCYFNIVERNDSIFDQNMLLQYSFSQPIGDSIVYNLGGGPAQFKIVLDSLKTQFICNQNRRVLYYSKYQGFCKDSLRIIEGIGPVNGYLFTEAIGACDLGPGQHYFNCANIVTCSYPASCSPSVAYAVNEISRSVPVITAYQANGTETLLFDNFLSGELELKDILGRNCISFPFKNTGEINFSTIGLNTGIYFVLLKTSSGEFRKKILIE
jgi:hypothetical protein